MSQAFEAMTAIELRDRIARREISPVEVTRRALDKAQSTQGSLNAFFFLMPEKALAAAKAAETAVCAVARWVRCMACRFRSRT